MCQCYYWVRVSAQSFLWRTRLEMVDDLSNGNLLKIFEDLVVIKDVLNSNERCNQFSKTQRYHFCVRDHVNMTRNGKKKKEQT